MRAGEPPSGALPGGRPGATLWASCDASDRSDRHLIIGAGFAGLGAAAAFQRQGVAYDQPEAAAGQGTIGAQPTEQAPAADPVLVPAGGGGPIARTAPWFAGAPPPVFAGEPPPRR